MSKGCHYALPREGLAGKEKKRVTPIYFNGLVYPWREIPRGTYGPWKYLPGIAPEWHNPYPNS